MFGVFCFFLQTDRLTQKSHPGDPEDALLGGQEEFSGKSYICIICMEQSYCIRTPRSLKDRIHLPVTVWEGRHETERESVKGYMLNRI